MQKEGFPNLGSRLASRHKCRALLGRADPPFRMAYQGVRGRRRRMGKVEGAFYLHPERNATSLQVERVFRAPSHWKSALGRGPVGPWCPGSREPGQPRARARQKRDQPPFGASLAATPLGKQRHLRCLAGQAGFSKHRDLWTGCWFPESECFMPVSGHYCCCWGLGGPGVPGGWVAG